MRERTGPVLRAGCTGLLRLAEGPCLSWLPLAFLARLPGLDPKPLPLTFDRRCYRTGLVARRSAEDLAPVRRFEQSVRDIALERPDGSNLPALAGRAPSRSAVRRLGDDRALVVGRSGNGHALSGESGDRMRPNANFLVRQCCAPLRFSRSRSATCQLTAPGCSRFNASRADSFTVESVP